MATYVGLQDRGGALQPPNRGLERLPLRRALSDVGPELQYKPSVIRFHLISWKKKTTHPMHDSQNDRLTQRALPIQRHDHLRVRPPQQLPELPRILRAQHVQIRLVPVLVLVLVLDRNGHRRRRVMYLRCDGGVRCLRGGDAVAPWGWRRLMLVLLVLGEGSVGVLLHGRRRGLV